MSLKKVDHNEKFTDLKYYEMVKGFLEELIDICEMSEVLKTDSDKFADLVRSLSKVAIPIRNLTDIKIEMEILYEKNNSLHNP